MPGRVPGRCGAHTRDEPMDLPRAQSPSPIPPEHQDLSLSRNIDRSKWDYNVRILQKAPYCITNPADDVVRMFANRGISAELKQAYVDKARQTQGERAPSSVF